MKTPKEFLKYEYGIELGEEKALIHPLMLVKAMEEYAMYAINELKQVAVMQQSEQLPCEHINLVAGHHPDQPSYCADCGYEP